MAMRFTYRSGERPLAGFTLKRGVGQGGFGEVYFAVSDSGKEVALKLLRGSTDVELRGVANCLNLKHPNLVHIYDLKTDAHGDTWLVMEYVLGESLAQVIDRHPAGLPVNLATEWFQSLARAVGYLHDHGVVHRDLKPANIFIEHGNLKVGDYGLCKAMAASHRQQTRTVGTVHYMAPEIASGNYTKSIDIYACGIVLHEMLTGKLVFDGESDGEVLMKHLTATPDLNLVPEPFRAVVAKALDKNPLKRYGSMIEFARAAEEAYPTRPVAPVPAVVPPVAKPASVPPPIPVTVTAPAAAVPVPVLPVAEVKPAPPVAVPLKVQADRPAERPAVAIRDRLTDLTGAAAKVPLAAAVGVLPWAVVSGTTGWADVGKVYLLTLALCWAVLGAAGRAGYKATDTWGRRLRMAFLGVLVGGLAFWLDGWVGPAFDPAGADDVPGDVYLGGAVRLPAGGGAVLAKYALYFACALGAVRWWRTAARDRKERFGLFPVVAAGFWGAVLMFLWPHAAGSPLAGIVPLVLTAAVVQWVSPWSPPPPPMPKRLRWKTA
jgi:hypothetical protein